MHNILKIIFRHVENFLISLKESALLKGKRDFQQNSENVFQENAYLDAWRGLQKVTEETHIIEKEKFSYSGNLNHDFFCKE